MRRPLPFLCIAVVATGCGQEAAVEPDPEPTAPRTVQRVLIDPARATLPFLDDASTLTARALDAGGLAVDGKRFSWTASDTTVVTVSDAGLVTAVGPGSATVTAAVDGISGTSDVAVDPGLVVHNECMRCHWERAPGEHHSWGFAFDQCTACHDTLATDHGIIVNAHEFVSAGFPLQGVHETLGCGTCHVAGTLEMKYSAAGGDDCVSCHVADYQRRHGGTGFPQNCGACHTKWSWSGAQLDHTGFPLSGPHLPLPCASCHDPVTLVPRFTPTDPGDCIACHQADYDARHAAAGYPVSCRTCHDGVTWTTAAPDHPGWSGGFRLLGAHATAACTQCHEPGTWSVPFGPASDGDCIACHRPNYDAKHASYPVPQACEVCHTRSTWTGAVVPHTTFVLTGRHLSLNCQACHDPVTLKPWFSPSNPDDCIACHRAAYERQHGGSGYPPTCRACHTTAGWATPSFDHDAAYFPINSGVHRGRWTSCATCHVEAADFTVFSCFACHTQAGTDAEHRGRAGYVYQSTACYSCHRRP